MLSHSVKKSKLLSSLPCAHLNSEKLKKLRTAISAKEFLIIDLLKDNFSAKIMGSGSYSWAWDEALIVSFYHLVCLKWVLSLLPFSLFLGDRSDDFMLLYQIRLYNSLVPLLTLSLSICLFIPHYLLFFLFMGFKVVHRNFHNVYVN